MPPQTPLPRPTIEAIAAKHGIGAAAVEALTQAMVAAGGRSAQFDHPELGGLGQWMSGGMLQIGDMFNSALKAKVDGVCRDVADAIAQNPEVTSSAARGGAASDWWPEELGVPASVGAQNSTRYAFFPHRRRLVIEESGSLSIYDTAELMLTGFAQQQGAKQTLVFSTSSGPVPLTALRRVDH
jgi:hypothetical protein